MKKITVVFSVLLLMLNTSCKKDNDTTPAYTCTTCVQAPEAIAANNSISKGIYKGVMIGSTGTIKLNIANNGTDITAVLVIDGSTLNLSSSVSWVGGQPYVAPFTGTFNGSPASITFQVNFDGTEPVVLSTDIPGHPNAVFAIVKETSNALVEGFIGTYQSTRPETGTFNILLSRPLGLWGGISRKNGATVVEDIDGTIVDGKLYESGIYIGNLNGDVISGTFVDSNQSTVTITGERTL